MAIKIQNTSEIEFDGVKCVVYGGPGVGKTRLCATAPSPIQISAEEGLLSISDVSCDFIEIKTLNDLDAAYRYLKNDKKYKTICLDSLSEIAEALITEILPDHKDGRQAYAALAQAMIPMLKRFRDIKGKNTVFTCKEDDIFDEDGAFVCKDLLLPGKQLNKQVPYLVDELFHMQIDRKGVPFLQTKPGRKSFAKDRSGALDPKGEYASSIEEVPNLTELFAKIKKAKTNPKLK